MTRPELASRHIARALSLCAAMSLPAHALQAQAPASAAVHPVATDQALRSWLARVPPTRAYPPDFAETLRSGSSLFLIEMSTAPGCRPCAHLWSTLARLRAAYGWEVRTLSREDALLRSGRLGLPWVGHPVAWVRPLSHRDRTIPVAIGADHASNIGRNLYLAAKMLTGVRPAVGVRGMARFTGIVGAPRRIDAETAED